MAFGTDVWWLGVGVSAAILFAVLYPTTAAVLLLILTVDVFGWTTFELFSPVYQNAVLGLISITLISAAGFPLFQPSQWPPVLRVFVVAAVGLLLWGSLIAAYKFGQPLHESFLEGRAFFAPGVALFLWTKPIRWRILLSAVVLIAAYLASVAVVYFVTGNHPPGYRPVSYGAPADGLHMGWATWITLSLLLLIFGGASLHSLIRGTRFLLVPLQLAGLLVQGHRALAVGTLISLAFVALTTRRLRSSTLQVAGTCFLLAAMLLSVIVTPQVFDRVFVSSYRELVQQSGGIGARITINESRWKLVQEDPFVGYGLLRGGRAAELGLIPGEADRFRNTVGTVDAGFLDLWVRFGLIGLIGVLLLVASGVVYSRRQWLRTGWPAWRLVLGILVAFIATSPTWSVLSYFHGLIPLALAVGWCSSRPTRFGDGSHTA